MKHSDQHFIRPASDRSGWIGGPAFDLFFFFGSGVIALSAGLLALQFPVVLVPLWFLWLWLVEGPHLIATWQRTYLDRQSWQQRSGLLLWSLLWMLPGPILLFASWMLGRPQPFLLFLGVAVVWSFHHGIRQYHGLLAIYQRLNGAARSASRIDSMFLHSMMWTAFVLFMFMHPENRRLLGLPIEMDMFSKAMIVLLSVALVVGALVWLLAFVRRWLQGVSLRPSFFVLVAVAIALFGFFVIGVREPILPYLTSTEQIFMAATVVGGTVHGLQYLGITFATSARRAAVDTDSTSLSVRLGKSPLLTYGIMVALSLLYLGINLLRGASPVASPVVPGSNTAQLFLALYWGLFFHHYWIDQKIWRPSADSRLRAELGLNPA